MRLITTATLLLALGSAACVTNTDDPFGEEDGRSLKTPDPDAGLDIVDSQPKPGIDAPGAMDPSDVGTDGPVDASLGAVSCAVVAEAPSCSDMGAGELLVVDPVESGQYDVDGDSVTLTIEGESLDFTATTPVTQLVISADGELYACNLFGNATTQATIDAVAIDAVTFCGGV